jgi:division protein CdvB (Snf7/Vps24/ESCRT-III family)
METINPTVELIKDIQRDISNVVPSANGIVSEVSSITSDVLVNSNLKLDIGKVPTSMDSEAISILNEVEGLLEDEAKVRLPEIPAAIEEITVKGKTEKPVLDEKRVMIEG